MNEKLKPCPFCGSDEATIEPILLGAFDTPRYCVICSKCGADSEVDLGKSGAVECWNTRPLEDGLAAERDALKERCAELEARLDIYYGNLADIEPPSFVHD